MNKEWIIGFTEGEGSFSYYNCYKDTKAPLFTIGQKNKRILEQIRDYMGYGKVYSGNKQMYYYRVHKLGDCRKIFQFFKGHLLTTTKEEQFSKWIKMFPYMEGTGKPERRRHTKGV